MFRKDSSTTTNEHGNAHGIHGSLHRENVRRKGRTLGEYPRRFAGFLLKRIFPQGALDNIHEVMFLCFFF